MFTVETSLLLKLQKNVFDMSFHDDENLVESCKLFL